MHHKLGLLVLPDGVLSQIKGALPTRHLQLHKKKRGHCELGAVTQSR